LQQVLPQGYHLRRGYGKDRALLHKFLCQTYEELFPHQRDFSHLGRTLENYFSTDTPLWWVEWESEGKFPRIPVGCIWVGNGIDQVNGDRYAYIFLLYVSPSHRGQGVAKALLNHAENWARNRGDRQIGLMVFETNQPALNLYRNFGYQTQSLLMLKPL
jgi:ribosomal protein S18 acetylase RimI-like enzyme